MAARRPEDHRRLRPTWTRWPNAPTRPSRSIWCRPSSGLARPIGTRRRAAPIFGLTRNSGAAEIARAALEAVGYQTRDLLEAMRADWPAAARRSTVLRVDGGMTASDVTMQFLADILASPVDRPVVMETTALGAAYLAGRAGRRLPGSRRLCRAMAARPPLRAADGCGARASANMPAGRTPCARTLTARSDDLADTIAAYCEVCAIAVMPIAKHADFLIQQLAVLVVDDNAFMRKVVRSLLNNRSA